MLRVAFLVAVLLAPSVAMAGPDAATAYAKEVFDRAQALYAAGKYEEALEQYNKAYDAKPLPGLLFNIGQCHRQLGNKERALFFYRRYLEQDPKAENRVEVEKRMAELERSMKEEKDLQQRPPTNLAEPPPGQTEAGAPARPTADHIATRR